jgi:predicted nucleic acid-binding protein
VILLDTNILLRSHPSAALYPVVKQALGTLTARNETLCIASQNLIEFWAVATRPVTERGLGMSPHAAAKEISALRQIFNLLPAKPEVLDAWQRIVTVHGVSGKQAHDAHLVAVMQEYAVASILTFNTADFVRFSGIVVLDPLQV